MTTRQYNSIDSPVYGGRAIIHFYEKKHYYTVSVPTLEIERAYQPGCTTIIGMKDKSGPLCGWAVNQCELYAKQKISDYVEAGTDSVPVERMLRILSEMKRQYRDVRQQAADVGKAVHAYLHKFLEEKLKDHDAELVTRPTNENLPEFSPLMVEQTNAAINAGLEWFSKHDLVPLRMESPVWSPTFGFVGTDDFIGYVDEELCAVDYKTSTDLRPEVWLQTAAYQAAYEEEFPHLKLEARWGINVRKDGSLVAEKRGNELFGQDFNTFLGLNAVWNWHHVHVEGKEPIVVVGALNSIEAGDWIDELENESENENGSNSQDAEESAGAGEEDVEAVRAEG